MMIKEEEILKLKSVKFREIMKYYKPTSLAIFGILASLIAAFQLPMFGFLVSKMTFTLMEGPDDVNYIKDRNKWTIGFAILVIGIAVFNFFKPDDDDRDAKTHPYDEHQNKLWSLVFNIRVQRIVGHNRV